MDRRRGTAAVAGYRRVCRSATFHAMNFCSNCGATITHEIPPDDNRVRAVCHACNAIHYDNPRMIVGCIAEWDDRILLCRRAIEPRHGLWTVPAGFMENGETTAEGAARETLEEANAQVEILALYALYNIPHINQVYLLFRGRMLSPEFGAGSETLETRLVSEDDLPWDQLAFATVRNTLRHYYADRRAGAFKMHMGTIDPVQRG
jgi:ADP-ribose pyrophosphatase YjhB (NUDIX family)